MRLRARLALAFALLALVPLAVVVPLALGRLEATLAREAAAREAAGAASAEAALERAGAQAQAALEQLVRSPELRERAQAAREAPTEAFGADTAEALMRTSGLGVLAFLDARGVTLSSGHLPARRGDPEPALAEARRAGGGPALLRVEVAGEAGVRALPALVAVRPLEADGVRLWALGGVLLDDQLAGHLARLSGAAIAVRLDGEVVARAGEAAPPRVTRALAVGPGARVELTFSRAGAREAQGGVERAFVLLALVGLLLAVLLGLFFARRITRPVEALTRSARRVAEGDLSARVTAAAGGEVGELVRTFNQMTAELRHTTERLVASERVAAWQEVARRLAHEIKNPLTPIQMSLETLQAAQAAGDARFPALFRESAQVVLEEVDRLRRIVDEFSRFARAPKPQLAPLALDELAQGVLALYAAPPPGVRLEADLAPGVRARADRDQLTQVLVNLVKNAEEAVLAQGGGTVRVRVLAHGADARLEVEDSGPGVPPELRARIFEPYFTTKAGGSGLGLAIAARILQEHGGRLEVDDAPLGGARFWAVLPRLLD